MRQVRPHEVCASPDGRGGRRGEGRAGGRGGGLADGLGGLGCSALLTACMPPRRRIIRAFLIEEQKIVKKVLKAQTAEQPKK